MATTGSGELAADPVAQPERVEVEALEVVDEGAEALLVVGPAADPEAVADADLHGGEGTAPDAVRVDRRAGSCQWALRGRRCRAARRPGAGSGPCRGRRWSWPGRRRSPGRSTRWRPRPATVKVTDVAALAEGRAVRRRRRLHRRQPEGVAQEPLGRLGDEVVAGAAPVAGQVDLPLPVGVTIRSPSSGADPPVVEAVGEAHEVAGEAVAADVARLPQPVEAGEGSARAGGRGRRSRGRGGRGCTRGTAGPRGRVPSPSPPAAKAASRSTPSRSAGLVDGQPPHPGAPRPAHRPRSTAGGAGRCGWASAGGAGGPGPPGPRTWSRAVTGFRQAPSWAATPGPRRRAARPAPSG